MDIQLYCHEGTANAIHLCPSLEIVQKHTEMHLLVINGNSKCYADYCSTLGWTILCSFNYT